MIVNSIYDIKVKIGGYEILDSQIASGFSAIIEEDISNGFPICQIQFTSSREFLTNTPIVDGTPVEIRIYCEALGVDETLTFRVSAVKTVAMGFSFVFVLDCFLDFYELFRNCNKYAARGLSSEIFKNVAEQNKLKYNIDPTNDLQTWIPSELNLGSWLNVVANHGWFDMNSCMYWFMNRRKELFYKNLDKLFYETKNIRTFKFGNLMPGDIEGGVYRYKTIGFKMETGTENIFNRGYDGRNFHFDLLSYSLKTDNANKVRAITEIVNINKELSQGLEENNLAIDCGNFHEYYFMAEAQNSRIRSSLSTYTVLGCEYWMPVSLGEMYLLEPVASGTQDTYIPSLNCKYLISSIRTKITTAAVTMEVELCTQGFNGSSQESY